MILKPITFSFLDLEILVSNSSLKSCTLWACTIVVFFVPPCFFFFFGIYFQHILNVENVVNESPTFRWRSSTTNTVTQRWWEAKHAVNFYVPIPFEFSSIHHLIGWNGVWRTFTNNNTVPAVADWRVEIATSIPPNNLSLYFKRCSICPN